MLESMIKRTHSYTIVPTDENDAADDRRTAISTVTSTARNSSPDKCQDRRQSFGSVPTDESAGMDEELLAYETPQERELRIRKEAECRSRKDKNQQFLDQAERKLASLKGFWESKQKVLQDDIDLFRRERDAAKEELENVLRSAAEGPESKPLGPKCLYWVREGKFTALCSLVVIGNLATMFMEMLHPHYKNDFFVLDQVVLVFYIVEVVLKALLFRRELLCGHLSVVWWNWLDLLIVIAGILDQWIKPLLPLGHDSGNSSTIVQVVKMLRIARLARILKTVRAFLESDLSWAEGDNFQLFIMGTIASNSLLMSFESDYPDFVGWFYVEQVLLIIFSFELTVRLKRFHCRFFYHEHDFIWNWLDFVIVVGGIIDQWLMPAFSVLEQLLGIEHHGGNHQAGKIMTILRMARLLRILRLVRLVKNIPPLFTLIIGILQAMQGMAWVLVLTAIFLYAFALLSVRLFGHGLMFGGEPPPEVAGIFPSVPQSMFVLFKVMNGDTEPIEPLFHALPMSKLAFVLYMVVSSWAILSILTAVVSENMIQATDRHRTELEEELAHTKEEQTKDYLIKLFKEFDQDDSGELGEKEFEQLLGDEDTCGKLENMLGLEKQQIKEIFDFLMVGDNTINQDYFIKALQSEGRQVTERSMFRLERRLVDLNMDMRQQLEKHMDDLSVHKAHARTVEEMTANTLKKLEESHSKLEVSHSTLLASIGTGDLVPSGRSSPLAISRTVVPSTLIVDDSAGRDMEPKDHAAQSKIGGKSLEDQLLPFQIALQIIEHRLDSIALESNSQKCESVLQRERSCEALLANMEERMGLSKHHVRISLQSILSKMEMHLRSKQDAPMQELLNHKLGSLLQTHQDAATESLLASIEQKFNISQVWRDVQSDFTCLLGRLEMHVKVEVNRCVSAAQHLSALHSNLLNERSHALVADRSVLLARASSELESRAVVVSRPPQASQELHASISGNHTSVGGTTGGTLEE